MFPVVCVEAARFICYVGCKPFFFFFHESMIDRGEHETKKNREPIPGVLALLSQHMHTL